MSRFHREPIATLPARPKPYGRRRRWPGPWVLLALFLAASAIAVWAVWRRDDPPPLDGLTDLPQDPPVPGEVEEGSEAVVRFEVRGVTLAPEPEVTESEAKPAPVPDPALLEENFRPRLPRDVFEAQIALTRAAICPGSIDGAWGGQTQAAVVAFQQKRGLRVTGQLENNTREALQLLEPPLTTYTVTPSDFLRLRPLPAGWLERSALDRLDFSTILELVAEEHWTHPNQIKRLNPGIDWDHISSGTMVLVPRVFRPAPQTRPMLIVIHLAARTLQVFDADSRLLAHFPCSIARRVDKRPVGGLEVELTAPDPNYTFNPETFPDSPEAQRIGRKLILQPGPNNPVGAAWIDLNLPGYGIHGSPDPEKIGRTESSGCFRLANWNARYLLPLVHPGMKVQVEP